LTDVAKISVKWQGTNFRLPVKFYSYFIFGAFSRFPLQSFFSKKDFHCNRGYKFRLCLETFKKQKIPQQEIFSYF
jgi:hypothetical protein